MRPPTKGGHPLLRWVAGDAGASGLNGELSMSLLMNLTCVTAATEKIGKKRESS